MSCTTTKRLQRVATIRSTPHFAILITFLFISAFPHCSLLTYPAEHCICLERASCASIFACCRLSIELASNGCAVLCQHSGFHPLFHTTAFRKTSLCGSFFSLTLLGHAKHFVPHTCTAGAANYLQQLSLQMWHDTSISDGSLK